VKIEEAARNDEDVRLLETIPGVVHIVADVIKAFLVILGEVRSQIRRIFEVALVHRGHDLHLRVPFLPDQRFLEPGKVSHLSDLQGRNVDAFQTIEA
jgi:hypothetical protein